MPSRASGPEIPLHLELHALVIACARSGFRGLDLSPETRERLAGMNDPLARFLRSLVDGGVPQIPPDLPAEVRSQIEDLLRACAEAPADEPDGE